MATTGNEGAGARPTALDVTVGDAYVRRSADGQRWTIGTRAIEQVFECLDGRFRLISFKNKLTTRAQEYVAQEEAGAPFALDVGPFTGQYAIETVWSRPLAGEGTVDPASDSICLRVQKGDRVGFGASSGGDARSATIEWVTTVSYPDGKCSCSAENEKSEQQSTWRCYLYAAGSGCLEPLADKRMLDATQYHLGNAYTLVRVWRAPADGVVQVAGPARLLSGEEATLSILRLTDKGHSVAMLPQDSNHWTLEKGQACQVNAGGRPAAQLILTLRREALRAHLRLVAYPGTSILRQWLTLENTGVAPVHLKAPAPLTVSLGGDDAIDWTQYWLHGGAPGPNQGVLRFLPVGECYHQAVLGEKSADYVPWTALRHSGGPSDGWFVALDYLGTWNMSLDHDAGGPVILSVSLPSLAGRSLSAGERMEMPVITIGAFHRDLDDMGVRVYNWQYEYLWDYTNPDYYARTKWAVPWFYCSRNLQEQFTARLAHLDMDVDLMRGAGFEMLWDDAGWSKYPDWPIPDNYGSVFCPTFEGPDFANTQRYLRKMGMKWLLWFCGRPSAGLMDTKVGAWGSFQFRTDGVGRFDLAADRAYRALIEGFLTRNPRCSFHTCDGGSRYAHQFEIQRLADVNYLSDLGRGPEVNYYCSYLDTPDKWLDMLEPLLNPGWRYNPDTSRHQLTMAPGWYGYAPKLDQERLRRDNELYHYLLREGVAGRWTYVFHPAVTGDQAIYYFQRTSHDRTKACIILRHKNEGEVTICPAGLLPDHPYVVGFASMTATTTRTGGDLMENGIVIRDQKPGELVFLNLPGRPGSGKDKIVPTAPGRVLKHRETNIGHSGVGLYWSPGSDDNWVSHYEVRRDDRILDKVSTGCYYFDHAPGWDPGARYAVRTVDGDGNKSEWTGAEPLPDEPLTACALGGHFSQAGQEGWRAETTIDGRTFKPMRWVRPARNPGGDFGGTPNQPGGVQGYWEGVGAARVGRGWQQASARTACVRAWTAPLAGQVRILGRAMKECYRQNLGTALRVRILADEDVVWPQAGTEDWAEVPLESLVGAWHDLTLEVEAGDTIRFVLGRSEDPENAILAWMPRIVYQEKRKQDRVGDVVRILCGAERNYTDHSGNTWSADRYHNGGEPFSTQAAVENATPSAGDQPLYQAGRRGQDFTYSIPVSPGLYAVRLKLAEPEHAWFFQRPFNLDINGQRVLSNADICWLARGPRQAFERVFRYQVPDAQGNLVLQFTAGLERVAGARGEALVQAIEVLPEAQQAVRVNLGSDQPFIDWNGLVWEADGDGQASEGLRSARPVAQAAPTLYDQTLYQSARCGRVIRFVARMAPALYTVHLKFAELWLEEPGGRLMDIEINGRRFWEKWDPATAAGQVGMAADLRVEDIVPDGQGRIIISISATGTTDAILQAVEIE